MQLLARTDVRECFATLFTLLAFILIATTASTSLFAMEANGAAPPASEQADSKEDTKGEASEKDEEWISLFDGKSFEGWKINENEDSWRIEDGLMVANGGRSHIFYMDDEFVDFHLKVEVRAKANSNSGIYFHTQFQEDGWPAFGYESQVNNTAPDPVKTGSIYNTVKLLKSEIEDDQWWTHEIIVRGKEVTIILDGKEVIRYTEPDDKKGTVKLGKGTFALQAHDPGSTVYYRNIMVRKLDEEAKAKPSGDSDGQ